MCARQSKPLTETKAPKVDLCSVQIAVGQDALVELYEFAALYGLAPELVELVKFARYPNYLVGLGKLSTLCHKVKYFFILGKCHISVSLTF